MIDTTSELKRKIMLELAQDNEIYALIDKAVEYRDDLIYENIFPYLKVDYTTVQADVYIGVKIDYPSPNRNELFKNTKLTIMIMCADNKMKVGGSYTRTDLLAELITNKYNWSRHLGFQIELSSDIEDAMSADHYYRMLTFSSISPNSVQNGSKIN